MTRRYFRPVAALALVIAVVSAFVLLNRAHSDRALAPVSTDDPAASPATVAGDGASETPVPNAAPETPSPTDGKRDDTSAAGDVFSTAAVSLQDDDGGTALLTLSNAAPGAVEEGCITVTYQGSSPAEVRLYGTTTGTGLDNFLHLTVTRGAFPAATPAFDACTGFTADGTDHIGAGPGILYDGTLAQYPDAHADGILDPAAWGGGETHAYRFTVTVADDNAAQGLSAAQTFTWEARGEEPPGPIPVVEPTSGPPGTVVTVGSGSDPCNPMVGVDERGVRVWVAVPETGEVLAEVELPVAADGSWSGEITVPQTAAGLTAVDFEAACYDRAGVTAQAAAAPYDRYLPVAFTITRPSADVPAPTRPASPATGVPGQPTYVG